MKRSNCLPLLSLLLGEGCLYLRRMLYRKAVDSAGLLEAGTALEWGVYALTVLSLLVFAAAAWKRDEEPFAVPGIAALGQLAGAIGIGWTVLRYPAQMSGILGVLWKAFGIFAAVCLLYAAFCTLLEKKPYFLVLLMPCLFWLVHMVDNYRGWSGQPQLQTYLFDLMGVMAITLFSYYTAAAAVGLPRPRMQRFTALAAGFLCVAAAMPGTPKTQLLYLLCALWALASLYSPEPTPEKGS